MGLSTHALDTMHGRPAAGMALALHAWREGAWVCLQRCTLNADGRASQAALLADQAWQTGRYRLEFDVGAYFRAQGVALPEPAFLEQVCLDFGVADASAHYHVPLLVSPWSYSTYRGS